MESEFIWCEKCQSRHTKEFGEQFHDRVIDPLRAHWSANVDKWIKEFAEAIERTADPYQANISNWQLKIIRGE